MATFKARASPTFNPTTNDFTSFEEWCQEFITYCTVSDFLWADVTVPIQQARLFNIAGADFMRFAKQHINITGTTTVDNILDAIKTALKPKRLDLQNRGKLFAFKQGTNMSAMQYLQELRQLYNLTGYPEQVGREMLIRDLFTSGISSSDARRLLFQEDSDNLTLDRCLHLVSSFEAVQHSSSEATPTEVSVSAITKNNNWTTRRCEGCGQQPSRHSRRKCPAYRLTCRVTHLDAFPIPLVAELLEQVGQYRIFSYIDLKAAFYQFRLDPKEWYLTAFEADGRLWEFTCIPFGLRNSPATFNRALRDIIGDLPGVVIYLDDGGHWRTRP